MRTMYDAVDASAVPAVGWDLLAGYVNGRYQSAPAMQARFPWATVVTIDVLNRPGSAQVLDVEAGDATPADAPGWFDSSRAHGIARPTIYCPYSLWPAVRSAMGSRAYDLWVADYGVGHCPVPGAVAWQKIDHGPHGENVDVSEVYDPTWPKAPTPEHEEDDMLLLAAAGKVYLVGGFGKAYLDDPPGLEKLTVKLGPAIPVSASDLARIPDGVPGTNP